MRELIGRAGQGTWPMLQNHPVLFDTSDPKLGSLSFFILFKFNFAGPRDCRQPEAIAVAPARKMAPVQMVGRDG